MAMVRSLFAVLVLSLVWAGQLAAQTGTVTGRVLDATTQQPVSGANVLVDGTQLGTLTRVDGGFVLTNVPLGAQRLTASLIGYGSQTQEVTVSATASTAVQFELQPQAVQLEELVATGYGTTRRLAITGSVAKINADEANVGVVSNANDMIQGRVAGVSITLNNGEPGANAQVRIRGGTSISASNEPLYVIDGVPIDNVATEPRGIGIGGSPPLARSPLSLLNPSDIESITILKDASATAIYGSRAANGVVLIDTKRGGAGGLAIEYDGYAAASRPASYLDVMSGDEYRRFVQAERPDLAAGLGPANTDWERALTRTGVTHNHNLAFSGGGENTRYRASMNYMNQEGVVINNGFERIQGRLNASHQALEDRLRLGLNLTASHVSNNYLPYENIAGFEGGVFTNMVIFDPTRPITVTDPETGQESFFERGSGRQEQRNPVAMAEQVDDFGNTTRTLGNVTAALDVLPGLTAQLNVGADRSEGIRRTYLPRISPVGAEWGGRARQVSHDNTALTLQSLLTLTRQISDAHSFDVVGGYEYAEYRQEEFSAEGQDFATDAFGFNNLGGGNVLIRPSSWREDSKLVSFFARANYNISDRYFLTGVLRRDGSSRFGAGNKWAVFPALSASWRLSEEPFLRGGMFSDLRLRAGFGLQGNQAVPPYASLITLAPGGHYVFGESPVTGIAPNRNPNPNLRWEETSQFNVALDYGFSNNRFSGTIEYYLKNTSDLLLEVPVPQPALVSTRLENIGEVRNQGVEFALDALLVTHPRLRWMAGLVFAAERNEVINLGGRSFLQSGQAGGQGQSDTWTLRIIPGEPLGTFFGPEFVGVDSEGKQLFRCNRTTDGCTGEQTTQPIGDDYRIIGNANPDFTVGLRNQLDYGKFDLSFLVRSAVGQDVFNNTSLVYATKTNVTANRNFLRSALTDGIAIGEPAIYSSLWVEDGSFVRLQNITLGYKLDLSRFYAQAREARVYVSADNLFLITGYSGYDPESHTAAEGLAVRGVDYLNYPRPRTFTAGIRVTF
jgi:TonB-linked SusC/RagA family outer membrane protein